MSYLPQVFCNPQTTEETRLESTRQGDEVIKPKMLGLLKLPQFARFAPHVGSSILCRRDSEPISRLHQIDEKVVFLNKANLEKLEGYKASVILQSVAFTDRAEIHIVITGKSMSSAERLFAELPKMKPEEVYGDNG